MITLEKLIKAGNGGKGYKIDEIPNNVIENIKKCIPALQAIENEWGKEFVFNSVYRSPEVNAKTPGAAKLSGHMQGLCFDIADKNQDFAKWIMNRLDLLEKYGIWIEHPAYTATWLHIGFIKKSVRAFKPKPDSVVVSKFFNGSEQPTKKITLENKNDNEIKETNNNDNSMNWKKVAKTGAEVVVGGLTGGSSYLIGAVKGIFSSDKQEEQPLTQEQTLELEKEKQDTLQAQEATKQAELLNASKGMDLLNTAISNPNAQPIIKLAYKNAYITLFVCSGIFLYLLKNKEKFFFDQPASHSIQVLLLSCASLTVILPIIPFAIAYPPIAKIVDAITDSLAQLCKFPGKAIGGAEYGGELIKRVGDKIIKPNKK